MEILVLPTPIDVRMCDEDGGCGSACGTLWPPCSKYNHKPD